MNNYIRIFDTTLRDGEQSPGATLTSAEKLEIARALARMGVDVMEAGFPAASPDDLEAVRRIALEVGQPTEAHSNPADHLRAGPRHPRRHRQGLGSRPARRPTAHPYLYRHLAHPYAVQAQDGP